MLLRHEVADGVEVLQVVGSVGTRDAAPLEAAVRSAVDGGPRGVLLDLSGTTDLAPEAVDSLNWLTARAAGWPRTTLAVCCAPADVAELLLPEVQVHPCRESALGHVDDRPDHVAVLRRPVDCDEHGPAQAREMARQCARALGVPDDDLVLVVSELVTNAVRHGAAPVELEIDTCEHCLTVVVSDGSPARPAERVPDEDAEGGRGLLLVDLLSHDHGVRSQPPGKVVWAELAR